MIFSTVYAGMMAGQVPGLRLNRSGIAVLGAIAVIFVGGSTPSAVVDAIDYSTLGLLFGLMVVSAQFRLGGAYTRMTARLATADVGPSGLLLLVIMVSGALSAILSNDIIALAMAPVLIDIARARRLDPVPFLLGLAAGANAGSAATLIGNPQNILVGQALDMPFARYLFVDALLPSVGSLVISWLVIRRVFRSRLAMRIEWAPARHPDAAPLAAHEAPNFNPIETGKGVAAVLVLGVLFVGSWWHRDIVALVCAGTLVVSNLRAFRGYVALVDWKLLALFAALFVLNDAVAATGAFESAAESMAGRGLDIQNPAWLFGASAVLSNIVSNVPATMILLPFATHVASGVVLALSSTLAGNLIIVGSIANIIVVEVAAKHGVTIGWRTHARSGIPLTLLSLAIAAIWLLALHGR
ncbi:MAG: SLC13 family permease [Chloroflexi bacterium]|nr:SLC13 family permease [Chloroflexota bacterium]